HRSHWAACSTGNTFSLKNDSSTARGSCAETPGPNAVSTAAIVKARTSAGAGHRLTINFLPLTPPASGRPSYSGRGASRPPSGMQTRWAASMAPFWGTPSYHLPTRCDNRVVRPTTIQTVPKLQAEGRQSQGAERLDGRRVSRRRDSGKGSLPGLG